MVLVFILFFATIYITKSYQYYQNVSFDLKILFHDNDNCTAFDGCNQYFGTKHITIQTLLSIDSIFHRILESHQNKSIIKIQKDPQTQLSNNFINCSSYGNHNYPIVVTSNTCFIIQTVDNSTNIIDLFLIESSQSLTNYLKDASIILSFHHKIITINNKTEVIKYKNNSIYLLLLLLIIPLILTCIACLYLYYKNISINNSTDFNLQYNQNVTVITETLVLIIAISTFEFENTTLNLDGVEKDVRHLKKLWQDIYNYSVFVCNPDTLHCTKTDVEEFVKQHLRDVLKETQCVIIHVISHASKDNFFLSSDMQYFSLEYIRHQLSCLDGDNRKSFLKIIFNHGCKGQTNFYLPSKSPTMTKINVNTKSTSLEEIKEKMTKINVDNKSGSLDEITENVKFTPSGTRTVTRTKTVSDDGRPEQIRIESFNTVSENDHDYGSWGEGDTNFLIVSATIAGRAMSDSSVFCKCIYNVFAENCNRFIKHGLLQLLTEVGQRQGDETNSAEICSFTSTLRHEKVQFEKCVENKLLQDTGTSERNQKLHEKQ